MTDREHGTPAPPPPRPWNIDGLIPREAWEDRSDRGLDERLTTLERRLHAAIDRVEDLPVQVERRLASLEAEVRGRAEELEASTAALERIVGPELGSRLAELAGGLATFESRLDVLVGVIAELSALLAQVREGSAAVRAEQQAAVRSVEARLVAVVQRTCDELVTDAEEVLGEARTTGRHLDRLTARLEDVDGTLGTHRRELADVLHDERAALVDEVLRVVLDRLPRRDRRRVAERLLTGRGATTEHRRGSDAPAGRAAERERLVATVREVPGVGPARADALAVAFGTRERLGIADAGEVAAFAGLPEDVAIAVRDHVRAEVAGASDPG